MDHRVNPGDDAENGVVAAVSDTVRLIQSTLASVNPKETRARAVLALWWRGDPLRIASQGSFR
jgi:hypothetical protein